MAEVADSLAVTLQQCGESGLQREEMVCAGSLGGRISKGADCRQKVSQVNVALGSRCG